MHKVQPIDTNLLAHNHNLTLEIQRRVDQLSAINTVAAVVSQSLDLNVTLQTALDAVLSVIDVEASGISLIDEQTNELVMRAQRGWKNDFVTTPMRIPMGHGMSGYVIAANEVIVTSDVSKDPRLIVPAVGEENIQAMAMAPMHARGKVIGILSVLSYEPYVFDEQEIAVLRAIADQVGLALDNARLYEATRSQQSRLHTVLQSTADAIISTDAQGTVNLINQAAERLFDLRSNQVIGQPLFTIALPIELRDGLAEAFAADMPGGFDVLLSSGRFLSAVISPVLVAFDGTPQQNGWVIVLQDISHIKEAERARLQFIQTAAHDLRNPLGVTLSALTMLQRSWKEPTATDREVFSIAMRGVNRMQDLIDDLLHLEKLESGVDFALIPFDIGELLQNAVQDFGPTLEQRNQQFLLQIAPLLPMVTGDARWLSRALANLLSNAHKYTPDGGLITLYAYADDESLTVAVQDNGAGIPPDAQARLFERFYRARHTENQVKGTGLGLAIVKSVMEKHHGRIEVQSAPGEGSLFKMILPLQPLDV